MPQLIWHFNFRIPVLPLALDLHQCPGLPPTLSLSRKIPTFFSDALDAKNSGGVATSDAVAGLAYYFSGHDYLDIPGLDVSPRAFPKLTVGAWVKVITLQERAIKFVLLKFLVWLVIVGAV